MSTAAIPPIITPLADGKPTDDTMTFHLNWKGISEAPSRRQHLERRLGFALARFCDRVRIVWAHISDQNGPRGGIDKPASLPHRLLVWGRQQAPLAQKLGGST